MKSLHAILVFIACLFFFVTSFEDSSLDSLWSPDEEQEDAVLYEENEWRKLQANDTEAPTQAPTHLPTASPTDFPTSAPTEPPEKKDDDKMMIFGIVGLVAVGVFLILFAYYFPACGNKPAESHQEENNGGLFTVNNNVMDLGGSRRMSNRTARESLSTIFSRDRFSTWSGRYSGKFEAAEGKDDHLATYVRDKRHEKNARIKRREQRNNGSNINGASSMNANRRQQAPPGGENASMKEMKEEDVQTNDDSEV